MIENGMLSGAAAHRDSQAAAADAQARMAQLYAAEVLDAISRNQPDAPISTFNGTETLTTTLIDTLYTPRLAVQFVEGLSLLRTGNYEQGAKVLLAWTDAAARTHGISTAELKDL